MRKKHRNTLRAVFADPVRSSVLWSDIEAMLGAAGAEISEGRGSRLRVSLEGVDAVFHRPHPGLIPGKRPTRGLSSRYGAF